MLQAADLDGLLFDAPPLSQDCLTAIEVDVYRREVADALMVAVVVRVGNETRSEDGNPGMK